MSEVSEGWWLKNGRDFSWQENLLSWEETLKGVEQMEEENPWVSVCSEDNINNHSQGFGGMGRWE